MRVAPRRLSSSMRRTVVGRSGSPAVTKGMNALRPRARRSWKTASIAFMSLLDLLALQPGHLEAVLVAAAGEADDHDVLVAAPAGDLDRLGDGVGGLQSGEDALELAA